MTYRSLTWKPHLFAVLLGSALIKRRKKLLVLLSTTNPHALFILRYLFCLTNKAQKFKAQVHIPKDLANNNKKGRPREMLKFYTLFWPFNTKEMVSSFQFRKHNTQRLQQCESRLGPVQCLKSGQLL